MLIVLLIITFCGFFDNVLGGFKYAESQAGCLQNRAGFNTDNFILQLYIEDKDKEKTMITYTDTERNNGDHLKTKFVENLDSFRCSKRAIEIPDYKIGSKILINTNNYIYGIGLQILNGLNTIGGHDQFVLINFEQNMFNRNEVMIEQQTAADPNYIKIRLIGSGPTTDNRRFLEIDPVCISNLMASNPVDAREARKCLKTIQKNVQDFTRTGKINGICPYETAVCQKLPTISDILGKLQGEMA